jgi:hypothetical protein
MTINVGSAVATGTYQITVTGTSGALVNSTTVSLTVTPGPNFSLAASPASLNVARGARGTSTITIAPVSGFAGPVTLSVSGLPNRVTASFKPNPATTSSALTLNVGRSAATGTFTITVNGTSGALKHKTTVTLNIH